MSKKQDAIRKLWELGNLDYLLKGVQLDIKEFIKKGNSDLKVVLASRRLGKCFPYDFKIKTTRGTLEARDIRLGDSVFGVNRNGRVELAQVVQIHKTGEQEVFDITNTKTGVVIATCTKNHKWLVHNKKLGIDRVIRLSEFTEDDYLVQKAIFESHTKVSISNEGRKVLTMDIGIDNDTHLYLTEYGYVTHNSFVASALSIEICINKPNSVVKYVCPQKDMIKNILNPAIEQIIADAPLSMKPEWKEQQRLWLFPNGSKIQLAGADKGNIESVRGGKAELCICDEAGFFSDLDYAVKSVLLPTMDTTNGTLVMISTPNYKDAQHEFHTDYIEPLMDTDNLVKYTLYDSPMVSPQKIQEIISRYPGGIKNPKFRCEYLCEIKVDESSMVIPEFNEDSEKECVKDVEVPPYRDFYTSCDPAFRDLTGVLFGYWDFKEARLVILDELATNGEAMTTDSLAKDISSKEKQVYRDANGKMNYSPFMRIMDNNNPILINDLFRLHDMMFVATKKDNKEAQINHLRVLISEGRVIISPKCKNLIHQLKNVKWNKRRDGFDRMKGKPDLDIKESHADHVDALIYLVRNIIQQKNPYPSNYGNLTGENVFNKNPNPATEEQTLIGRMFGRRK